LPKLNQGSGALAMRYSVLISRREHVMYGRKWRLGIEAVDWTLKLPPGTLGAFDWSIGSIAVKSGKSRVLFNRGKRTAIPYRLLR
jgi:hypothetical protein